MPSSVQIELWQPNADPFKRAHKQRTNMELVFFITDPMVFTQSQHQSLQWKWTKISDHHICKCYILTFLGPYHFSLQNKFLTSFPPFDFSVLSGFKTHFHNPYFTSLWPQSLFFWGGRGFALDVLLVSSPLLMILFLINNLLLLSCFKFVFYVLPLVPLCYLTLSSKVALQRKGRCLLNEHGIMWRSQRMRKKMWWGSRTLWRMPFWLYFVYSWLWLGSSL